MRWDGQAYAEDIKYGLQKLLSDEDRKNARIMSHIEFTSLFKKHCGDKLECFSRFPGSGSIVMKCDSDGIIFDFQRPIDDSGETTIELSWSMAARHIRAWECEKRSLELQRESKPKSRIQEQWDNTHLCVSKYFGTLCEYFLQPSSSEDTVINGKKLDKLDRYSYYCTAENKVRKIGGGGSWTGLPPKFCPKRKALEEQQSMCDTSAEESAVYESEKEDTKMTPNFNFKGFISEGNQLKQVPLDMLVPYHNHKFKLYEGERLDDMVNSIKENGVLTLIIVRNMGGEHYEILAGHNRTNAARLAGLSVIPAIVKENLSDDEAKMYVIETNVMQRGFNDLSISERATVISARHSAMFDEDKRRAIERELAVLNGDTPADEGEEQDGEKKSKLAAVARVTD